MRNILKIFLLLALAAAVLFSGCKSTPNPFPDITFVDTITFVGGSCTLREVNDSTRSGKEKTIMVCFAYTLEDGADISLLDALKDYGVFVTADNKEYTVKMTSVLPENNLYALWVDVPIKTALADVMYQYNNEQHVRLG